MYAIRSGRHIARVLALVTALAALGAGSADALQTSKNVYRIPFTNGTTVKVFADHVDHSPIGRVDMGGVEGSEPYRIVAAADGVIRYIVDYYSAQVSGGPCTNNYVWIEHANGEWTKYSHMRQNSTTQVAGLHVGQAVKAGTFLGYEGEVGCASGPHLHFEVGVPRAVNPITTIGGFLNDNAGSKRNRIPRICAVPGKVFDTGKKYKARSVPGTIPPGAAEVARHHVKAADYQCLFDQAIASGYELRWIDGFDVGGKTYFNALFQPKTPGAFKAFHGLSAAGYQNKFDALLPQGFRPVQVESYLQGGKVRYAVIFKKVPGPAFAAYHGLSPSQHQNRFDQLVARGFRPVNVSVVSPGGNRTYTALFEKRSLGSWVARSFLTASQYQQQFESNLASGRQVIYLATYLHQGAPRFSAIFSSKDTGPLRARHGMTGGQYQSAWSTNTGAGYRTRLVTGYEVLGSPRYAAVWRK